MVGTARLAVVAVLAAMLLAGCAAQVESSAPGESRGPAELPAAHYLRLSAQGKRVLRVDPAGSIVTVEVRRGGSLARFGHDHLVATHDVTGYIAPDEGRADLLVPLATLSVDEPALRAEAGLGTAPSATDIEGTRRNMLDKVLEVERYPYALVSVDAIGAAGPQRELRATVTLHGTTRPIEFTAQVDATTDGMVVTGTATLDQTSFGIAPFSILGGAISVEDRLRLAFRIRASLVD
jgi:polyisoprenoid-binding protein YceI